MPDRHAERDELRRLLNLGESIQMLAPRRIGKTWLMERIADDLKGHGWTTVFVDVEGMRTPQEVLRELCRKIEAEKSLNDILLANVKQRFRQVLSNWDGSAADAVAKLDTKEFSETLIATLNGANKPTLILIDEIALFVSNLVEQDRNAAHDFLYHLRRLRQAYRNVRWLYSGSIGLDVVGRRHGLQGAQVDMRVFPLEPFSPQAAQVYLKRLADKQEIRHQFTFDDNSFDHLAKELGWLSPYYLKLIADLIKPATESVSGEYPVVSIDDVDHALEVLLSSSYRENFAPWEEHIEKNFTAQESACLRRVLEACGKNSQGEKIETLLAAVNITGQPVSQSQLRNHLSALENDGFLQRRDGRWQFRSGILRRYWLEYMCE